MERGEYLRQTTGSGSHRSRGMHERAPLSVPSHPTRIERLPHCRIALHGEGRHIEVHVHGPGRELERRCRDHINRITRAHEQIATEITETLLERAQIPE